jgi:hypothetical protein
MLEGGQLEIARGEEDVEIEDAVAVEVHVETADAGCVGCEELAEGREAVRFAHEDRAGDVEREVTGSVDEAERRALVVLFADDGPERGRTQRDLPPFLRDVRGGDDEGAAAEEAEDVEEEFGGETIDGPQFTFEDVDLSQDTIEQEFDFCELLLVVRKRDKTVEEEKKRLRRRTSVVRTELDGFPLKQISVVSYNSRSSARARVRAKRCVDPV